MPRKKKTDNNNEKATSPSKVKFSTEANKKAESEPIHTTAAIAQSMREAMLKSVKPVTVKKDLKGKYDQSKVTFSARDYGRNYDNIETKGWRRLSDSELKELAQVDPYISAIISTRCSQASIIGRPSDTKFDKGTRISELAPRTLEEFDGNEEKFKLAQRQRQEHMKTILSWIMRCGTNNKEIVNATFAGADPTFKYCTFPEFLTAQIRNLMTFGRCATQVFRDEDGLPVMFRPIPVETIYPVQHNKDMYLAAKEDETQPQSIEDAEAYNQLDPEERPAAYVQRIDGQNVNAFTEDDLKIWHFQKQALFDLSGFPMAPIEQAIYMVFVHQQTLGYLRNQYVKGIASKGILNIESTDPTAQLSDEDVEQLRREFHNFVNRNDNSAAVPVIAGPVQVKYVSLSPTPRDMEFLQLEEHVVRALCSAFQISPQEMGYGNLSIGDGGLNQANKQEEIIRGEERGLRMLLDIIYDGINEILYECFDEAKDLYRISYVGVGEDTRNAVVNRQQMELQTTATMSSLWADSEKTDPVPFGGNVPLSKSFHESVVRYMKYGQFMESFFGIKDASKTPEYDFIIDPSLNEAYQQLKVQPIQMQQEAAQMQVSAQEQQLEMSQMQMQMGAQQGQQQPPDQPPEQNQEENKEAEKSLKDAYAERQKLAKSVNLYFREWINLNKLDS
jgi:hypothetical protein